MMRVHEARCESGPPKAAVAIIGDEILNGQVQDTNTGLFARAMFERGIDLVRQETISDDVEDIKETVQRLSTLVGPTGFVLTSGGIGSTHDDVTYDGVAAAFGRQTVLHDETFDQMRMWFEKTGTSMNADRERMAMLPNPATQLHTVSGLWTPVVQVENVYVFPGIPWMLQQMLLSLKPHFKGGVVRSRRVLFSEVPEGEIASVMRAIQEGHDVSVGSYPNTSRSDNSWATKVTIHGTCPQAVDVAIEALIGACQPDTFSSEVLA